MSVAERIYQVDAFTDRSFPAILPGDVYSVRQDVSALNAESYYGRLDE